MERCWEEGREWKGLMERSDVVDREREEWMQARLVDIPNTNTIGSFFQ